MVDSFEQLVRAATSERWADARLAERPARAEALAAPFVAAVRACVADARGPDWPEQAWDSYSHQGFVRDEWAVLVPFAALTSAATAVVPVGAAERILGLPEGVPDTLEIWERLPPGRYYRRWWAQAKRYLCLVAEIAARFPADGGERLARQLRAGLRRLPTTERAAVEYQLAVVGLLDDDPARLAQRMLAAAEHEDLGTRGELVHHALRGAESLSEADRTVLLRRARAVARRTTLYVASNPYAAVVEALAADEVASVDELVDLVRRAVELRAAQWDGWDRALLAAGRSLTRLTVTYGEVATTQARELLARYHWAFPAMDAMLLLAGARGLEPPRQAALAREALRTARRESPVPDSLLVEVDAAAFLAEVGAEGGLTELRATAARLVQRPGARGHQRALYQAVVAACRLATDEAGVREALGLADRLRERSWRWLAHWCVATAAATPPPLAVAAAAEARAAYRHWLLRRPPLEHLGPLAMAVLDHLPTAQSVGPSVVALVHDAATGALTGHRFAAALAGLGSDLTEPAVIAALCALAESHTESWWRLPGLALATDGAAVWLDQRLQAAGPAG